MASRGPNRASSRANRETPFERSIKSLKRMGAVALVTAVIVGKISFGWGVDYATAQNNDSGPGGGPATYIEMAMGGGSAEQDTSAEKQQQLEQLIAQAQADAEKYEREQTEAGNKIYAPYSVDHEDEFEESMRYLMTRDELNLVQVFAVLGNVAQESKFNPTLDNGYTKGLIQYEGGRRDNLLAFMQKYGYKDPNSVEGQLRFIFWEHQNDTYEHNNLEAFRKTTNIRDATSTFCEKYERPSAPETEKRVYFANKLLSTAAAEHLELLNGYIENHNVK